MTLKPWTVESSRDVVNDRWLTLRAERCRRSDGSVADPYYVTDSVDWVSVFAITPSRDLIQISEYHHGAATIGIGLPGGALQTSDEPPERAARRELREETGFEAGSMLLLASAFANWGDRSNKVHFYLAQDCVSQGEQLLDDGEEIEVRLAPLKGFDPAVFQQSFHLTNALLAISTL